MNYSITKQKIETGEIALFLENQAYSGVKKIADIVAQDICLVFGVKPEIRFIQDRSEINCEYPIVCATVDNSNLLDEIKYEYADIQSKREVYKFEVENNTLFIVGSDKRGTIYGLFKLSELLGVSPFVNWLDAKPKKMESFTISSDENFISKEPSVRFRGFFINDEWPAFGNWCNKHFGGFTKECYIKIFELLLRMHGNYLWPAMWSSIFSNDGPGIDNAALADEFGVIMGLSHHEPCLRHGEEYKYLRGKDSIYGDAWNFRTNEAGITRFWEDGLKRNGKFENVITVGMRGEADSTIMGKDATLKDNIDLLKDVLKTQNRLIQENVCENLDQVPRMLALYKEVEPFFYGDENTEGLMNSPELEGVTLMLCDDNFGNMRTLPTEEMRAHKGGYGMYYHFDYHGWPISFEWVNSSYLPKVWEQMTQAYEFGINELWIVNVGDVFTNEYPLNYFLDMAYDYEKWGISNLNSAKEYTTQLVKREFGNAVSDVDVERLVKLLYKYTKIANNRRPEAMSDDIYSATWQDECSKLMEECSELMKEATDFRKKLPTEIAFTYYQLIYYPLMANLNVQKLWLATALNHLCCEKKYSYASKYASIVEECLEEDTKLVDELHTIANEKWYGMGMSEHIGFKNWNEEECQYPVVYSFKNANKPRIAVSIPGTSFSTEGGVWTAKPLVIEDFLNPSKDKSCIRMNSACGQSCEFECSTSNSWITIEKMAGTVDAGTYVDVQVGIDRKLCKSGDVGEIIVKLPEGTAKIFVPVLSDTQEYAKNTFIWQGLGKETEHFDYEYISIEAAHYSQKKNAGEAKFVEIPDYGKTLSGMKVFPITSSFDEISSAPYLEYSVVVPSEGTYSLTLLMSPSNPAYRDNKLYFGVSCGDYSEKVNVIPSDFKVSDDNEYWKQGVLNNIHTSTVSFEMKEGLNTIRIYHLSPGFVLQKLLLTTVSPKFKPGYLGPEETYRK